MAERELQLVEESGSTSGYRSEGLQDSTNGSTGTTSIWYIAMHFAPLLFGIYFLYLVYKNIIGIQIRNCLVVFNNMIPTG